MGRKNDHFVRAEDYKLAQKLRREQSPVEKKLWDLLGPSARARGIKFRRQHPISPYVVDFVCLASRVVVEVDGMSHDARVAHDVKRTAFLEKAGYKVFRVSNQDVCANAEAVVDSILNLVESV